MLQCVGFNISISIFVLLHINLSVVFEGGIMVVLDLVNLGCQLLHGLWCWFHDGRIVQSTGCYCHYCILVIICCGIGCYQNSFAGSEHQKISGDAGG